MSMLDVYKKNFRVQKIMMNARSLTRGIGAHERLDCPGLLQKRLFVSFFIAATISDF